MPAKVKTRSRSKVSSATRTAAVVGAMGLSAAFGFVAANLKQDYDFRKNTIQPLVEAGGASGDADLRGLPESIAATCQDCLGKLQTDEWCQEQLQHECTPLCASTSPEITGASGVAEYCQAACDELKTKPFCK